jgi:hypothetical protein
MKINPARNPSDRQESIKIYIAPQCPIHRALCDDGWDERCQTSRNALVVACPPTPNQTTVISTEAAHAFVSRAAEKSASLPQPLSKRTPRFCCCSCFLALALRKMALKNWAFRGAENFVVLKGRDW